MTQSERDLAAAVVWLAKSLCGEYYLGWHEGVRDRRNDVYKQTVEDNWHKWVPQAKAALAQALPTNPENVTVPGWVLQTLLTDAEAELARAADGLGKAGHAASEQLQVEYKAVDLAKAALVGVELSPPPVEF